MQDCGSQKRGFADRSGELCNTSVDNARAGCAVLSFVTSTSAGKCLEKFDSHAATTLIPAWRENAVAEMQVTSRRALPQPPKREIICPKRDTNETLKRQDVPMKAVMMTTSPCSGCRCFVLVQEFQPHVHCGGCPLLPRPHLHRKNQKSEKEVRRASTSTMQDWGTTLRWAPIRRTPSSRREPHLLERAERKRRQNLSASERDAASQEDVTSFDVRLPSSSTGWIFKSRPWPCQHATLYPQAPPAATE